MSRKDYRAAAEILKNYLSTNPDRDKFSHLVADFGLMFKQDNPRFNDNKFMEAIYGKEN